MCWRALNLLFSTLLVGNSKPNLTPEQIQSAASNREDLLREFSGICRAELEGMQELLR